jgi:hypothetical protein
VPPRESDVQTQEFSDDDHYFQWVNAHPMGHVLSVRGGRNEPLIHSASCPHIDRHNNLGALTKRGTRKICAESKQVLRNWMKAAGKGPGLVVEKCPTCSP